MSIRIFFYIFEMKNPKVILFRSKSNLKFEDNNIDASQAISSY